MAFGRVIARVVAGLVALGALGGGLAVWRGVTNTNTILSSTPLGKAYNADEIAVDGHVGRAVASGEGLSILDTRDGHLLRTIALARYLSGDIVVSTTTDRTFVLHRLAQRNVQGNVVSVLDTRAGTLIATVPVPFGPTAAAIDGTRARTFVTSVGMQKRDGSSPSHGSVSMLDARSGAVLFTDKVGRGPSAVAIAEKTGHVFVANRDDGTVSIVNANTGRVVRTVRVGTQPSIIAVDDRMGHVFVANQGNQTVSMLDARTGALIRTLQVGFPAALAVDARAGRVIIATTGSPSTVAVVDAASGVTLHVIEVGGGPTAVGVDARTSRAFIVNTAMARGVYRVLKPMSFGLVTSFIQDTNNYLSVVDTRSGALVRTIRVAQKSSGGIAVDEQAGHAFLANPADNTVLMLDATR